MKCYLHDPRVAEMASDGKITRTQAGIRLAVEEHPEALYVFGNAPTALMELCALIRRGEAQPAGVVAAPVGFVHVEESKQMLKPFRTVPRLIVEGRKGGSNIAATLPIDMEISLSDVNIGLVEEMDVLLPVGQGNPEPKFLARGVRAAGNINLMGAQRQHFHFNVAQEGIAYRAVVFNNLALLPVLQDAARRPLDMVFTPALNTFYSPPRLELRIEDLHPSN